MTPFMLLSLPTVTVSPGPEWASLLNAALTTVDEHDHSDGKGTPVTPAGLNINDSLEFNNEDAIELRSTRYTNHASPLAAIADITCIYISNGDLYYNNEDGTAIQITADAGLNATSIGGIGGDFATSSAAVTYSNTSKAFRFTQASGINAHLDTANISIREAVSSANAVTLKSPTSLGASYNWLFPTALPATGQTKFLTIDSSGQVGAQYDVDNATIEISSNNLRVKDASITTAKLVDLNVTTAKIADLNVTTGKIADGAVTKAKLSAANYGISFSCGNYEPPLSTVVYQQVTNLSVTITTSGRPVVISLMSDGTTSSSAGTITVGAVSAVQGIAIRVLRDSTVISQQQMSAAANDSNFWAVSSISVVDVPSAGTYTYSIQALRLSPTVSGSCNIRFAQLVVRET